MKTVFSMRPMAYLVCFNSRFHFMVSESDRLIETLQP